MRKNIFCKTTALLTMAAMLLMTGCGNGSDGAGAASSGSSAVSDNGEVSESTNEKSENAGTQLANPWRDATEEEVGYITESYFKIPEGATNVVCSTMDIEGMRSLFIK